MAEWIAHTFQKPSIFLNLPDRPQFRQPQLYVLTRQPELRFSTNTRVMAGSPLSVSEAWRAHVALRRDPEIEFASESSNCESEIERVVS